MRLPSPNEIKSQLPLSLAERAWLECSKEFVRALFEKTSQEKLVLLVGPCSLHDEKSSLEFAENLKKLSLKLKNIHLVMRAFIEKPRSSSGWKGLLNDPNLDGSEDIEKGLHFCRHILSLITAKKLPIALEIVNPLMLPYFDDLLSWAMVGARTSASQIHRQIASGLSIPVGFKNSIFGELDPAISAIVAAKEKHTFLGIDQDGQIAKIQTLGNSYAHFVLRGAETTPNYDSLSIQRAIHELKKRMLPEKIVIDCSHGNSGKDYKRQPFVFQTILKERIEKNLPISGIMLESHLFEGRQSISSSLTYGVSVTDSCIGWDETEDLILWADEALSMSMGSLQS